MEEAGIKRLIDHAQRRYHVIMQMRDAVDVAARFVGARMHEHFRRRFVFALDHFAVEVCDDHIVGFDRRPADRMRQDQQMIGIRVCAR